MKLQAVATIDLHQRVGQCRAAALDLGQGQPRAFIAAYAADFDVDPFQEMFFFPTDTLKLVVCTTDGQELWTRDLGRGVVPGVWFCPVFTFDLDGKGYEDVWFVDNVKPEHPLSTQGARLARLDGRTGEVVDRYPWINPAPNERISHWYRNFILGGQVRGEPVLVAARGTYGAMKLVGYGPGMQERWRYDIPADAPGARGSHMCPVLDINGDGVDELLWGERCISLADGRELWCADRDSWSAHSDVIQPVLRDDSGAWSVFTCREGDDQVAPRIVCYDAQGRRQWGDLDQGHIDMGWVARLGAFGDRQIAMGIRIGGKTCGPEGRFHKGAEEFLYDLATGERVAADFSVYRSLPVDLDGDGRHELVRGQASGDGEVLDTHGRSIGNVGGAVAMLSKFCDRPGEQMLVYREDGRLDIWADLDAADTPAAKRRYAHPLYRSSQQLTATGYNLVNLGGI